jgi:DNA primase
MRTVLDDTEIEQIKSAPGVMNVYRSYARGLRQIGDGFMAKCPMHPDDTASFHLSRKNGTLVWFYHGACQRGGSVIDLVMECDHLTNGQAIQKIKQELSWEGQTRVDGH